MLKYRLMLGPVLIALLIAGVWLDEALEQRTGLPGLVFLPVLTGLLVGASIELSRIVRAGGTRVSQGIMAFATLAGIGTASIAQPEQQGVSGVAFASTVGTGVFLISLLYYSRHQRVQGVVGSAGAALLAFTYLGLLGGFVFVIRRDIEDGAWIALGVIAVTKSYDIFAFFTGRFLGRHKLIAWLSPGKTWEGFVGGIAGSTVVCVALVWISQRVEIDVPFTLWQAAAAGAVFGVIGQAGDLIASLLKRDAGIKDASGVLPGFGGILDIIDSPLLVGPAAYWALNWATLLHA